MTALVGGFCKTTEHPEVLPLVETETEPSPLDVHEILLDELACNFCPLLMLPEIDIVATLFVLPVVVLSGGKGGVGNVNGLATEYPPEPCPDDVVLPPYKEFDIEKPIKKTTLKLRSFIRTPSCFIKVRKQRQYQ
jgi:hypothetical protein